MSIGYTEGCSHSTQSVNSVQSGENAARETKGTVARTDPGATCCCMPWYGPHCTGERPKNTQTHTLSMQENTNPRTHSHTRAHSRSTAQHSAPEQCQSHALPGSGLRERRAGLLEIVTPTMSQSHTSVFVRVREFVCNTCTSHVGKCPFLLNWLNFFREKSVCGTLRLTDSAHFHTGATWWTHGVEGKDVCVCVCEIGRGHV